MGNCLTHFISIKQFSCFYSSKQRYADVSLLETVFFGLAFLQATCCLDNGQRFQNGTLKI